MRFTILLVLLFPLLVMSTVTVLSFDAVEGGNQMAHIQNPEEMPTIVKLSMSRGGYRVPKFFEIELDGQDHILKCDRYEDAEYHVLTPEAMAKVRDVIFRYDVRSWDGFDKVDRFALDGEDFNLYITFADGTRISAKGSNRFPENYRDVFGELETILEDGSSYR